MNRRQMLTRLVALFSLVGAAGLSIPFIRSLMPARPGELVLDVDVADLAVGQVKVVRWSGRHVLIVNRGDAVDELLDTADDQLNDPLSQNSRQPEFATNRIRARQARHIVVYANCTHLGCEVEVKRDGMVFSGFACPCHRSHFDVAGRVEKGAAAKLNLEVPQYSYAGQQVIRLQEIRNSG